MDSDTLQDLYQLDGRWREDGKTRNVHLGSARKMDAEAARLRVRERKAEVLGIKGS